jgi:hypothetical protein
MSTPWRASAAALIACHSGAENRSIACHGRTSFLCARCSSLNTGLSFCAAPPQACACERDWNNPPKAGRDVDEDDRPQYRHEEGQWKPARGHQGVEKKLTITGASTATANGT